MSAIEESLEAAAANAGDITQAVYTRLFAAWPDMEALFIRDTNGAVRGQMLSQALEAVLDLSGPRYFAHNLIAAERVNHDGLGVPPEVFAAFFPLVRDTVREAAGGAWTGEMETAWNDLLAGIAA